MPVITRLTGIGLYGLKSGTRLFRSRVFLSLESKGGRYAKAEPKSTTGGVYANLTLRDLDPGLEPASRVGGASTT